MAEATGDALTLFPRGPVAGSPRRTVYKHTCVKVPLSLITTTTTIMQHGLAANDKYYVFFIYFIVKEILYLIIDFFKICKLLEENA